MGRGKLVQLDRGHREFDHGEVTLRPIILGPGQGLCSAPAGQALIAHALAQAWAAGCYKVVLTTSRQDPAVWAFYERCGFSASDKRAFVARRPAD